jgi:hypothetical protein
MRRRLARRARTRLPMLRRSGDRRRLLPRVLQYVCEYADHRGLQRNTNDLLVSVIFADDTEMLVLAWRAGPGWIVLFNEDDEMHAVPYETITKPQSVRSKLRRAWMWRDTTNRPDEWWSQIVDLNSTGTGMRRLSTSASRATTRASLPPNVACTAAHEDLDVFHLPVSARQNLAWHRPKQSPMANGNTHASPTRFSSSRSSRMRGISKFVVRSTWAPRGDTRSARFCPRGDTATIDRRADVRPPVVAPIALTEIVGQALTS